MRIFRPALLVLLIIAVAGLGVPAGIGQAKAGPKRPAKKKSTGSGTTVATHQTGNAVTATSKKSPGKTANKTSGKSSGISSGKSSRKSRKQPGQKAPTMDRINEIQTALAKDGSFRGTSTGKWDSETADAMRRFQVAHGLKPNGKLDAPTLQRLGLGSQIAGVAKPTPPPGSVSRLTSSTFAPAGSDDNNPQY